MTEERRENLEWKIKHSCEVAAKARARGDMDTYYKLKDYIARLQDELLR